MKTEQILESFDILKEYGGLGEYDPSEDEEEAYTDWLREYIGEEMISVLDLLEDEDADEEYLNKVRKIMGNDLENVFVQKNDKGKFIEEFQRNPIEAYKRYVQTYDELKDSFDLRDKFHDEHVVDRDNVRNPYSHRGVSR